MRHFRRVLPLYGRFIEVDEFRTSITCSACLAPTVSGRVPVHQGPGTPAAGQPRRKANKGYQVSCFWCLHAFSQSASQTGPAVAC